MKNVTCDVAQQNAKKGKECNRNMRNVDLILIYNETAYRDVSKVLTKKRYYLKCGMCVRGAGRERGWWWKERKDL